MNWQVNPTLLTQDAEQVDEMPLPMLRQMRSALRAQFVMSQDENLERMLHKLDSIIEQKSSPN